jgi:hypothetical protein
MRILIVLAVLRRRSFVLPRIVFLVFMLGIFVLGDFALSLDSWWFYLP